MKKEENGDNLNPPNNLFSITEDYQPEEKNQSQEEDFELLLLKIVCSPGCTIAYE